MALKPKEIQYLKRLGERLRMLRKQKGWTLEETEARGWPSWRHLQKIESGKNITLVTLNAVCRLYGVRPSEVLEELE